MASQRRQPTPSPKTPMANPPRTSEGHPDLQGFWNNTSVTRLERPENVSQLVLSELEAERYEQGSTWVVNAKTQNAGELKIPVVITVYADRSFSFITKTPPAPDLLMKAAGVDKGSATPNKTKVGSVTRKQVEEIAQLKMPDLNCFRLEAAIKTIEGTARNMGLTISD